MDASLWDGETTSGEVGVFEDEKVRPNAFQPGEPKMHK